MAELDATTVTILLGLCVTLLVVALALIFRISGRLGRLEMLLDATVREPEREGEEAPSVAETSPGGAFEEFLHEDAARLAMTKSEQFAAYRHWRREKGMNWAKQDA